jgi:hypothetical protein
MTMKSIEVNYTEIQVVEFTKSVEVTEAQFKQIHEGKLKAEDLISLDELEGEASENGSHYVQSRSAQLKLF